MPGSWYGLGVAQSFGNDATGDIVSLAAVRTVVDGNFDFLSVADYLIEHGRVLFAPGAIEDALTRYGAPKDQQLVNRICERALQADPEAVAAKYAEMIEQEQRERDAAI